MRGRRQQCPMHPRQYNPKKTKGSKVPFFRKYTPRGSKFFTGVSTEISLFRTALSFRVNMHSNSKCQVLLSQNESTLLKGSNCRPGSTYYFVSPSPYRHHLRHSLHDDCYYSQSKVNRFERSLFVLFCTRQTQCMVTFELYRAAAVG